MSTARPTIYDVARRAGVSKSLVSLVLRGSDRVSAASRTAVEAAIQDLGYRPSRAATDLAAGRTKLVAVLIDDYANPWFVELLRGLGQVLDPEGYRLTVVDSASAGHGLDPVEGLLSMRADGVVLACDVPARLAEAAASPIVIAGTRAETVDGADASALDAVANDDRTGARLAAEHLVGLGHRRIGHLAAGSGAARARAESFVAAARSTGADVIATDYSGPATEAAGLHSALKLLTEHPDITAVFAANDMMAIGALGAARDLGIDVPAELSIVGYDNTPLARTHLIGLTTVDDSGFGVGREAARLLLARLAGGDAENVTRTLQPSLVVRGTTAPARRS
ncbi:LacI family DNA-binding transcriptional regulator [Microbacterium thalassium]|uniref:DNA-binding LacI/PurR family transcriptional regulator n=1 Tax=Microbacterium thalassium TaxID=362649 RepID=A0A7X0FN47_9MICO|nr:LacI family DNA-binding transcriptional regulator [Microbacterium thalassium]MBB6390479.1 DNA-binding LacI/PurR family transcriptional regulator [Microbacterium thalassium]GLK25589.1 LacI family transcriptional regulator [Microbacterium thalassium]